MTHLLWTWRQCSILCVPREATSNCQYPARLETDSAQSTQPSRMKQRRQFTGVWVNARKIGSLSEVAAVTGEGQSFARLRTRSRVAASIYELMVELKLRRAFSLRIAMKSAA